MGIRSEGVEIEVGMDIIDGAEDACVVTSAATRAGSTSKTDAIDFILSRKLSQANRFLVLSSVSLAFVITVDCHSLKMNWDGGE